MIDSFFARLRGNLPKERAQLTNLLNELISGEIYEMGDPWRLTSQSLTAVVPILKRFVQDRGYLVLQEIPKEKVSLVDSGQINKIDVLLKGVKRPVFVRAGTIFKGQGTQSRTSGIGVVLVPGKVSNVDAFCVHATHGISRRSRFSLSKHMVPRRVEDVLMSPLKSQTMVWTAAAVTGFRARTRHCPHCGSASLLQTYEAELVCMECGYVIAPTPRSRFSNDRLRCRGDVSSTVRVRDRMVRLARLSRRDNLVTNLDEVSRFNREVEKTLSKVPADLDNQVGVVIIDSSGVLGLEMFDHPDPWRAFSRSIVRNYADVLAKEQAREGLFELKTKKVPDAVKSFLEKAQKLKKTSLFKNNVSETIMLSGELAGEYTIMETDVIHLILKRKTVQ